MRSREKEHLHAACSQQFPRKRLQLQRAAAVIVGQLRMNLGKWNSAASCVLLVHATGKHRWHVFEARMMQQQPSQLSAGISGYSNNGGLEGLGHDSSIVLSRASTSFARRTSGQITKTVSSPAIVPITSLHPSRSSAAASG